MNNKNKSIPIMMSAVIALIASVATTPAAFAHTKNYMAGYTDGSNQAVKDYWNGTPNSACPTRDDGSEHTSNYCAGYTDGYRAEYLGLYNNHQATKFDNKQTIGQSSEVNIKGNNNKVVVTQQANNGAQQPISGYPVYGSDGKSSSSGQSNPRCLILCANVRIN